MSQNLLAKIYKKDVKDVANFKNILYNIYVKIYAIQLVML